MCIKKLYHEIEIGLREAFSLHPNHSKITSINLYTHMDSAVDSLRLKDLYTSICETVGENLTDRLMDCFARRFLVVPLQNAFLQGFTDSCLYTLLFRDIETNKQVFQLILDDMEEK